MSSNSKIPRKSLSSSHYIFSSPTDAESKENEYRLGILKDRVDFRTLSLDRDLDSQGFKDGTFDVIICSSLGPLCDPDRALVNIRQLLKPGGKACLVDIMNQNMQLSLVLHCLQALSR